MSRCPKCGGPLTSAFSPADSKSRAVCNLCGWKGPVCFGQHWDASSPKCRGGNDPTYWDEERGHKRAPCECYQPCAYATNKEVQAVPAQPSLPGVSPVQVPRAPLPAPPVMQAGVQRPPVSLPGMPGVPGTTTTPQMPASLALAQQVGTAPRPMMPQPPPPPQPGVVGLPTSILTGIRHGQTAVAQQQPVQVLPPPQAQYPYGVHTPSYPYSYQQPQMMMMVPMGQQANFPAHVPQNFVIPGQQVGSPLSNPESLEGQSWWAMVAFSLLRGSIKGAGLSFLNIVDNIQLGPFFKKL